MYNKQSRQAVSLLLVVAMLASSGCLGNKHGFRFSDGDLNFYQTSATEIEVPVDENNEVRDFDASHRPRSLENPQGQESWNLTLQETIQIALANSKVFRSLGGSILASGNSSITKTILDPAIVESDPLSGVEGALSEFDAQLNASVTWRRGDRPVNSAAAGLFTGISDTEAAVFTSELSKVAATGTTFGIGHNVTYDGNNSPSNVFDSAWEVDYVMGIRHPFLQGSGVEFNRIAGPNHVAGAPFRGVLIARINTDRSLAEFEIGVRDFVSDVENAYWELYFAYRDLDAKIAGRDSALRTWREVAAKLKAGARGGGRQDEAQARAQYFAFQAAVENALSGDRTRSAAFLGRGGVYRSEANLRYLMGLPQNDGRLIVPGDQPTAAKTVVDWGDTVLEGLSRRAELRRQKWFIQQKELELIASRNHLLPRLDGTAGYRWLGWGDDLINPTRQGGFDNAYEVLTRGGFQEWELGVELSVPIGYRREAAGVRNAELWLARSRAILEDQELELVHNLSSSVRELERTYQVIQTNYNRLVAAIEDVDATNKVFGVGRTTLDELLRAQQRRADAEIEFHRAVIQYNLAIKELHFEKGSLLEYNGVMLAESPWTEDAHFDASERATHFKDRHLDFRMTRPGLVSQGAYSQQQEHEQVPQGEMRQVEKDSPNTLLEHIKPPMIP